MWELYDDLINGIPENLIVDELIMGNGRSYVQSGNGSGSSGFRLINETRMPIFTKNLIGAQLREVAACVKSWNIAEASIGVAAINAYYNNPKVAKQNGVEFSDSKWVEDRMFDPFIMSQNDIRNKRVAVVGHFPHLENLFEPKCELYIIEWEPEDGDYPIAACEYILPQCDYVYLSSFSISAKTLPRMLELSKNAQRITIVGTGTPLSPVFFNYGVEELAGFIIKDNHRAFRIISGAENVKIYTIGQKVSFKKRHYQRKVKVDNIYVGIQK